MELIVTFLQLARIVSRGLTGPRRGRGMVSEEISEQGSHVSPHETPRSTEFAKALIEGLRL